MEPVRAELQQVMFYRCMQDDISSYKQTLEELVNRCFAYYIIYGREYTQIEFHSVIKIDNCFKAARKLSMFFTANVWV